MIPSRRFGQLKIENKFRKAVKYGSIRASIEADDTAYLGASSYLEMDSNRLSYRKRYKATAYLGGSQCGDGDEDSRMMSSRGSPAVLQSSRRWESREASSSEMIQAQWKFLLSSNGDAGAGLRKEVEWRYVNVVWCLDTQQAGSASQSMGRSLPSPTIGHSSMQAIKRCPLRLRLPPGASPMTISLITSDQCVNG